MKKAFQTMGQKILQSFLGKKKSSIFLNQKSLSIIYLIILQRTMIWFSTFSLAQELRHMP